MDLTDELLDRHVVIIVTIIAVKTPSAKGSARPQQTTHGHPRAVVWPHRPVQLQQRVAFFQRRVDEKVLASGRNCSGPACGGCLKAAIGNEPRVGMRVAALSDPLCTAA
jgi:hypothetical protein